LRDPGTRKLSFTGSTEVGRTLIERSAEQVLRVSMEHYVSLIRLGKRVPTRGIGKRSGGCLRCPVMLAAHWVAQTG
jgi:hypothetical protein